MKFVSYLRNNQPRAGLLVGPSANEVVDLHDFDSTLPTSLREILAGSESLLALCATAAETGNRLPLADVQLLPPITDPRKIICVGLNYRDHAKEMGSPLPSEPVIFNKFPTALAAHGEPIVLPPVSEKVDYEAELVAVIGRGGRNIPEATALEHVFGYAPGHDVSARDWQKGKPAGQWLLGKTFDTFAPLGPALVTADEVGDPGQLEVTLRINGEVMQNSSTSQFIFSLPQLIAYISQVTTLEPGDLLYTGTPPGVGTARKPPRYLQAGDVVEIEIEKLGLLRNPVIAG